MSIPTLNDRWKEIERKYLDTIDAPDFQRREMKRAFFMGAQAFYSIQMDYVVNLPDDESEKVMESLHKQLEGFCEALKLGAA